jgi:hypothetical protein
MTKNNTGTTQGHKQQEQQEVTKSLSLPPSRRYVFHLLWVFIHSVQSLHIALVLNQLSDRSESQRQRQ